MTNPIALAAHGANAVFVPDSATGNIKSRLSIYARWLDDTGRSWWQPDLAAYRDDLLAGDKAPVTVEVYLIAVRQQYKALVRNRDLFYDMATHEPDTLTRKAIVDEIVVRIQNAIEPGAAPVKVPRSLTMPDGKHLWLSEDEAAELIGELEHEKALPKVARLRNAAIVTLALTTGLRAFELCALEVPDLDQSWQDHLAVHVRKGKGMVERVVPYGDMMDGYVMTKDWLEYAGITEGRVFRGFYKGYKTLRPSLSVRAVQKILERNPIDVDGTIQAVKCHDLRRTYARWLYYDGLGYNAIRLRLGHRKLDQTLAYIGLAMEDV